jgi:hypothetical protein
MRRGFVYACSHAAWLRETVESAESVRRYMPDLRRQLFIERALIDATDRDLGATFDDVVVLDTLRHKHRPRFEATLMTDLEQAIFIDSDTLFLAPVHELFDLLEHYDIAATLAPQSFHQRAIRVGLYEAMPKVSEAQREWNTGLIVARVDAQFHALVESWSDLFSQGRSRGVTWDQAPFRIAAAISRLRIATLPENYNFRANIPRFANGQVKMLHAHGDLPAIAAYINSNLGMRIYMPRPHEIYGPNPREFAG